MVNSDVVYTTTKIVNGKSETCSISKVCVYYADSQERLCSHISTEEKDGIIR